MDISAFATRRTANDGIWWEAAVEKTKIGIEICVLGADSDKVQKYEREQRRRIQEIAFKGIRGESQDEQEGDNSIESAIVRMSGIRAAKKTNEKIVLFDEVLSNDEKSYRYLLKECPRLVSGIISASNDVNNFLSKPKGA